jgi:cytochrome b subunit of formate dehydrogenase
MKFKILPLVFYLCIFSQSVFAQENDLCLECHEDEPIWVDRFINSVHGGLQCIDCHSDLEGLEEFPHAESLNKVRCGNCHEDEKVDFDNSIHGKALALKIPYAPDCKNCHGDHYILRASNPMAPTFKLNVPFMCGKCHREGAPVAEVYKLSEHNILQNYSQSIHGEGLFRKGLIVTATCTDCHTSHKILPHTDPRSSTSYRNIVKTCTQCHSRIEKVHVQVIEGKKWKKAPHEIPKCVDCHLPHKVRKESLKLTLSDRSCLSCHEKKNLYKTANGDTLSLYVSKSDLLNSAHFEIPCVQCHTDVNPKLKRPCATSNVKNVNCASCHQKFGEEYYNGSHGKALLAENKNAPYCSDCHGSHDVKFHTTEESRVFRTNIPDLCGSCHKNDRFVVKGAAGVDTLSIIDYSTSVHGKMIKSAGLLPSAVCSDCHDSHLVLPADDPSSSVNRKNVPATCSTCHRGVYKKYVKSIHFPPTEKDLNKYPNCEDCHSSHKASLTNTDAFMKQVTEQCGTCHEELAKTYFQTIHGKVYKLGRTDAAKCTDCHGSHEIRASTDPESKISPVHIQETCAQCHEDVNKRFTGYLTHATHHDKNRYPVLYYTYLFMSTLLISVFLFFGFHTLLWLPKALQEVRERRRKRKEHEKQPDTYYIVRFTFTQRLTHLFVILSFMALAVTGMMLKFSGLAWTSFLAGLIGGVRVAGVIHRIAAIITFGYFLSHLYGLLKKKHQSGISWIEFIFGKDSMMFNKQDVKDFIATVKWFFGMGPKPAYGRWTYWEKFDYFAVFWGVAVIGLSGLMLWFPTFFTKFLPGWIVNVAHIVHSDEALLAVGFIFTIHFFNTHLRPDAFPMDEVIFTGMVPLEEFKEMRPKEYQELEAKGELEKRLVKSHIDPAAKRMIKLFGLSMLTIGIIIIGLIIYSMIFGYKF